MGVGEGGCDEGGGGEDQGLFPVLFLAGGSAKQFAASIRTSKRRVTIPMVAPEWLPNRVLELSHYHSLGQANSGLRAVGRDLPRVVDGSGGDGSGRDEVD